MKIAVCFCGEPRSAQIGKETMTPFYKGSDVDFFIHAWSKTENIDSTKNDLTQLFNPCAISVESYENFDGYFGEHPIVDLTPNMSNAISWFRSVLEVGKLLENSSNDYDWVIFTRTDIAAIGKSFADVICNIQTNTICSSFVHGDCWKLDCSHLKDRGQIDAKFLCSSKQNMIYFSKLFERLREYVIDQATPVCHHRLIYHHLKPLIRQYCHQQIVVGEGGLNGGWFFIRDGYLQGT